MSDAALYVPDRAVARALRRIDPDLTLRFVDPPGRWGVYYGLPSYPERLEDLVDRGAVLLQAAYAKQGRTVPMPNCQQEVFEQIQEARLVCYVCEDNGDYRPLDGRIVKKLQRMDYLRRNLGMKDWRAYMDAKMTAAREAKAKAQSHLWGTIERDQVFKRCLSDILWGLRPTRSVIVPDNFRIKETANGARPQLQ